MHSLSNMQVQAAQQLEPEIPVQIQVHSSIRLWAKLHNPKCNSHFELGRCPNKADVHNSQNESLCRIAGVHNSIWTCADVHD